MSIFEWGAPAPPERRVGEVVTTRSPWGVHKRVDLDVVDDVVQMPVDVFYELRADLERLMAELRSARSRIELLENGGES